MAADLAVEFRRVADQMEQRKFWRYAEQLRSAGLSPSNNIAEGSGSEHTAEFRQFLNIARRSLFEDASMLMVFERMGLIEVGDADGLLEACNTLSRKITAFSKTL